MKEEYFKPAWIKVVLGFLLIVLGILFTFLVYRFIPVPKATGFDGLGPLLFIFMGLGLTLLIYIGGVIFSKNHPYMIFSICLGLFVMLLVIVRWWVIG